MLVSGFIGAAGTDATTSVTISIGAVTRTELGYSSMATRSISCGEGRADVRAARAEKRKAVYIMTVVGNAQEA